MRTTRSAVPAVLIVEPDESIRMMIEVVLRHADFRTHAVGAIEEAVELIAGDGIDVVVRDLNLARVERARAKQQLVGIAPELLKRTVLTTTAPDRVVEEVGAAKAFAVIRKPFDVEELVRVVRNCAQGAREHEDEEARVPPMNMHTVQHFVKSVPALRDALTAAMPTPHELLVRNEMRRTMRELADALYEASEIEHNHTRAAEFFAASVVAADLATGAKRTARAAARGNH
jgi:DNA-binding NtrC family response regulator